jgi:hypothetical protein
MNHSTMVFLRIMAFYIFLSYILAPIVFYYAFGRNLKAAGKGYMVGSILSVMLWQLYGSKMI